MPIVFIISGVAVVLFLGYLTYNYYKMKNTPEPTKSPKIKQLTNKNMRVPTSKGLLLVDFWAPWCAPCKLMLPVLNEIAESDELNITVGKLNVDQNKIVAKKYKVGSIPTLILFKDGKEATRIKGVKSRKAVLKEIKKFVD